MRAISQHIDPLVAAGLVRTRHEGRYTQEPTAMGPVTTAVFDDTCGNLIQIAARAHALARRALPP